MWILNHENYFSTGMMIRYMSNSQFKAFEKCQAAALAEIYGEYSQRRKCYQEGKYFEACICGKEKEFKTQNPEMFSSKGDTKGELKSNYKRVAGAVEAFMRQPVFSDIIKRCKQQVIVTGKIGGVLFKGCVDFLDMKTLEGYDSKAMKDFKKAYSNVDGCYLDWYFSYGYHYQMAIYRELILQTFGSAGSQRLMAVTKEEIPDVAFIEFSDSSLKDALEIVEEYAPQYHAIKLGEVDPERCEQCAFCKSTKIIEEPEIVCGIE